MKRILSTLLAVSLLALTVSGLVLANTDPPENNDFVGFDWGVASPYFLQVTGTVVSVDDFDPDNEFTQDWLRVGIETEGGGRANIIINEFTFFPFDSQIEIGDVVTGYYLADWPIVAIYPPQYTAIVLVNGMPDDLNVYIDRFFETEDYDYDFLSRSEMFAFNVGENTEIVMADPDMDFFEYGTVDALAGRRLVVVYGASTRGIPEVPLQDGEPYKVIVLFETAIPLGPPGVVTLPATLHPFEDLDVNDWFFNAVVWAYENEIMNGVDDTVFAPDATTTRAMLVTVLWRYAGRPEAATEAPFTDLVADWYQTAVAWAAENGIVEGLDETTFNPTGTINREQMYTILYRYMNTMGLNIELEEEMRLMQFADEEDISDWALDAMFFMFDAGVMFRYHDFDNYARPRDAASRGEIAGAMFFFNMFAH